MSRLAKHMLSHEPGHIVDFIHDECKEFIKFFSGSGVGDLLISGTRDTNRFASIIKLSKRNGPKEMPRKLHDTIDDAFKRKFGVRLKSESFYSIRNNSDEIGYIQNTYGPVHFVVPIGRFKLFGARFVDDLFAHMMEDVDHERRNEGLPIGKTEFERDKEKYMMPFMTKERVAGYVADYSEIKSLSDLRRFNSGQEVMLVCDDVMLVNNDMNPGIFGKAVMPRLW